MSRTPRFTHTRRTLGLAAAAAATLVLSACGNGGGDGQDADEIVFGFALSQSGNMAPFDVEPGQAAMLRIDELNSEGGIGGREIRTVSRDVRSNPETVGSAVTELIAEEVDLLILPCDFDLSAPGATAAQSAEIPAVSLCAGAPQMADQTTLGDYIFTGHVGSDVEAATGATWAAEQGWENAFLFQDESIEYTQQLGSYFVPTFEELGGEIIGTEAFPGGDSVNISSQAATVRNMDPQPDFIYMASWNPGGATATRQLREAGVEVPIIGPLAMDGQDLLDITGYAEDVYFTAAACYNYCDGFDSEDLQDFVDAFAEETGAEPSTGYALFGYNLMSGIANALEEVDSLDGETLRDALAASTPVDTPVGEVDFFSEECHKIVDMSLTIVSVEDGGAHYVDQQRAEYVPEIGDGNTCVE